MPSHRRLPSFQGALTLCVFLGAAFYAAVVHAACGCYSCLTRGYCELRTSESGEAFDDVTSSIGGPEEEFPFAEFRLNGRWSSTAGTGGSTGARGNPVSVTWGFVADGVQVSSGGNNQPSNLISLFNGLYGAGTGGITTSPWFSLFQQSFNRWSQVAGITYSYEPADGGAALDNTTTPAGQRGVYADVRIGGRSIDGSSGANTLAFNYFPNHGDMVFDTDNSAFFNNRANNSRALRNVIMHEAGHGLGFNHLDSDNSGQLMEPTISTAFDGPQIDDILAAQRNYGDPLEKGAGNDSLRNPTPIGQFAAGASWVIGADGAAQTVSNTMTDFVSIDGSNDLDHYRFTVTEPTILSLALTQVGRTYNEGPQNGAQTPLDTSRLKPLNVKLYSDQAGSGIVQIAEGTPRGDLQRTITQVVLSPQNSYYIGVEGLNTLVDNVQLYRLNFSLAAPPIPEPAALAMMASGAIAATLRRRAA
jgi:hypothetical protein